MLAVAGARILGLNLFDKPGTLDRYWKALVGAYALDALMEDASTGALTGLAQEAEAFLRDVLDAEGAQVSGVGQGEEIHLRGQGVVGHALVWDEAVVHLSAFPV